MSYLTVPISASGAGDNTLITGVAGQTIRVHKYVIVAAGAVTAQFWDGPSASGTALSGVMSLITGQPIVADAVDPGRSRAAYIFTLKAGDNLVIKLGGAVQVSGHVTYSVL